MLGGHTPVVWLKKKGSYDLTHVVGKINNKELELAKAEAQLIGFKHGQEGYSLKNLVSAMALKPEEWAEMQKEYEMTYLTKVDVQEITEEVNE